MKTITLQFLFCLMAIAVTLASISCEKDDDTIKINEFKVEPQSDTAPTEVLVIYEKTVKGGFTYKFIINGAYSALENGYAYDTLTATGMAKKETTRIDTLKLYYLSPGTYDVILEAGGKKYSDSFSLILPE